MKKKLTTIKLMWLLTLVFVVLYTWVVASKYPETLRMVEQNAWVNEYVLQLFRWPVVGALLMALLFSVAMWVVAILLKLCRLPRLMPVSVVVALVLAFKITPNAQCMWTENNLFSEQMRVNEILYHYQHLADDKKWDELKDAINKCGDRNSPLGMRYLLLAESAQGTLLDNLFFFPITQTEDLLYRGLQGPESCTFNRQFYDNIGIYDECFHQAQEYAMTQRYFCLQSLCYMIDYSIKEAEWAVAEKLLTVLDDAWFYGDFVADRRSQVAEGKLKKLVNDAPIRQDNFVTGYSFLDEMIHDYMFKIGDLDKIQDYIIAAVLVRKQLGKLPVCLKQFPRFSKPLEQLPENVQQAMEIFKSKGEALHDAAQSSYAYYFYNVQIPEVETRYASNPFN